jgi:hypothetical protein
MTTSQNYSGRKVDLSLFPDLKSPSTPVSMTVEGAGRVIAGAAKAAQGFLLALLSSQGERPGDPEFGTKLLYRLRTGGVRYPSDIDQIFTMEASRAMDWWNSKSKLRPTDEQIKNVELVARNISQTDISMSMVLTTLGGDNVTLLLPVKWSN